MEPQANWEIVAAVSSAVIALCALFLAIWQGYQARKYNRISVTPHLTTWTHSDEKKNLYVIEVINNGIGPAVIQNFRMYVDGQLIQGEDSELVKKALKILFPNTNYNSHQSYFAKGYVMAEKEKRPLVAVAFHGENVPSPETVDHAMKRSRLVLEYQSMYGQSFCLDSDEQKSNK